MKLQSHIIAGAVGATVFYPLLGLSRSFLFLTASVLIDSDHYLEYLWRTGAKDWSPKRMFRYYDQITTRNHEKTKVGFSLFHTVEIFALVYFLGKYVSFDFFMPILFGMAYHMVFDVVWLTYHKVPTTRAYSIVEYFIRRHDLRKKGIDPDEFYRKMFELSAEK